MKAVELSASSNLLEKRVAYVCAGLCFAPEHEFRMMLVNRLQRDLQVRARVGARVLGGGHGTAGGDKVETRQPPTPSPTTRSRRTCWRSQSRCPRRLRS